MTLPDSEIISHLALLDLHAVPLHEKQKWLTHFGSAEALLSAKPDCLKSVIKPRHWAPLQEIKNFDLYKRKLESLRARGISILDYKDPLYPERLKHIEDFPHLLFYRGNLQSLHDRVVLCVVGSRKMTDYGKRVLEALIPPLVEQGVVIVSGMAFGVDMTAHSLALHSNGKTVGVQAQGVDQGYPRAHQQIFENILASDGLILSEFPYSESHWIDATLFPRRNRILSGLSDAVLIIEARERSGTLVTARFALEQNRDIYAVPAAIFSVQSAGCLRLIREGAKVVASADDILQDFGLEAAKTVEQKNTFATPFEEQIFSLCLEAPQTLDEITALTSQAVSLVAAAVTQMELQGKLRSIEGCKFMAIHGETQKCLQR